jgi:hypothetical protein
MRKVTRTEGSANLIINMSLQGLKKELHKSHSHRLSVISWTPLIDKASFAAYLPYGYHYAGIPGFEVSVFVEIVEIPA